MKKINIAIDGPSAAGKSTLAKALAEILGYVHIDTGAMYRCAALKAMRAGLSMSQEAEVVKLLKQTSIVLLPDGRILLDGEDVSQTIRTDALSMNASTVSKNPLVRVELVAQQREMAKNKGFIMDGRDIGSVVLHDAEVKVFQTATAATRAKRRYEENVQKGISCTYEDIEQEINKRDLQDTTRDASPLVPVDDALILDTSAMGIKEAVETILRHVYAICQVKEETK